jgi:hypothetical protein
LKHHRHPIFVPQTGGLDRLALDENLARLRLFQPDEMLEQDGFAAASTRKLIPSRTAAP